jgi:hypothetical protein
MMNFITCAVFHMLLARFTLEDKKNEACSTHVDKRNSTRRLSLKI